MLACWALGSTARLWVPLLNCWLILASYLTILCLSLLISELQILVPALSMEGGWGRLMKLLRQCLEQSLFDFEWSKNVSVIITLMIISMS